MPPPNAAGALSFPTQCETNASAEPKKEKIFSREECSMRGQS